MKLEENVFCNKDGIIIYTSSEEETKKVGKEIAKLIKEKKKKDNKKYMIVVVSEGAIEKEGRLIIKKVLEDSSGLDNIRLRRSR